MQIQKVRNDIVPFRHIITESNARLSSFSTIENVKIPLYYISCIGILLIDGFRTEFMPHLIVLAVTNVISPLILILNQTLGGKEVVNNLSIFLFLFHSIWQRIVANQLVNNRLKYNIEILDQQILFLLSRYEYLPCFIKECVAQVP